MKTLIKSRHTSLAGLLALSLGVIAVGITPSAQAQKYWGGGTAGLEHDWGTAANWNAAGVPVAGNYLFITNTTSLNYPIISSGTFTNGDIWHGAFNSNPARLDITGGTLFVVGTFAVGPDAASGVTVNHSSGTVAVSGGGTFFVAQSGATGTYNLSGDAVLTSTKTLNVGYNSTSVGTFNMTNGTLTVNNSVNIGGRGNGADGTPTGTFNMSGGTFTSTSWFSIGESGAGGVGIFNLTGGTVNAATSGGTAVNLGDRDGASGTLNVSGGTFNSTGGGIQVGNHWTGSGINSGTLNLTNAGVVNTGPSSGNGIKLASSAAAIGTVNLDGGILMTHRVQNGAGAGTFNFNGGTLKATANNAAFMQGVSAAYVLAGGAIIDTTNFTVTIAQSLSDGGGGGGLTKLGNGTLTLSGANGYTGPTVAREGTLTLDATLSPIYGSVVVSNGAALGLSLNNGASTVTAGSVTFNGNTALNFNYGTAASPVTAMNASSVSVTGTNTINITGQSLVVGQYVLIFTGSSVPTNNFKLGTLPTGVVATLVNSGTSLDLLITASGQNLTWYGADSVGNALTNWDVNTSSNWNVGAAKYLQYSGNSYGDNVTFDDTLYLQQATNVNLAGRVVPSTLVVNSTLAYSITGTGGIDGVVALQVNNTGSLFLGTSNSYTGGTVVGGTASLIITNGNALGNNASSVALAGGTLQVDGSTTIPHPFALNSDSTVGVATGATAQFNGAFSGAAGLAKVGDGTLTLGGSYTGGLIQLNGPVNADTASSITANNPGTPVAGVIVGRISGSSTDGTLNMVNGTLSANGEIWVAETGAATGTVNQSGGTVNSTRYFLIGRQTVGTVGTYNLTGGTVNAATNFGLTSVGDESGATGILNISGGTFNSTTGDGSGVGMSIGTMWSGGTDPAVGTVNVSGSGLLNLGTQGISLGRYNANASGTVNLNGGTLQTRFIGKGAGSGTVNFNGGTLRATGNRPTFLQGLTVVNVLSNSAVIDTDGYDITIAQQMLDGDTLGGGLKKLGGGTLTLNGANFYTGSTVVSNGVLAGIGSITGPVLITLAGRIGAGDTAAIGTLTINNDLTIQGGANLRINKTGGVPANDAVAGLGTVNYGGTLTITNVTTDGSPLVAGDTFPLFSATTHNGNFTSIVGTPGVVYSFNNGVLTVVSAIASNPTNITFSVTGNTMSLSWPASHLGWVLQQQTNSLSTGLSTNWADVAGSASLTATNITISPATPTVFFRLRNP